MKSKVIYFILFVFLFMSSCSDDEVDFNNDLLGTWVPVLTTNTSYPYDAVIEIFNSDRTGYTKYVTYTDKDNYTDRFTLDINNVFFHSKNELSITSDTYNIDSDGNVSVSKSNRSTYINYIDYIDNDSLVLIDNHNGNKWHYIKQK